MKLPDELQQIAEKRAADVRAFRASEKMRLSNILAEKHPAMVKYISDSATGTLIFEICERVIIWHELDDTWILETPYPMRFERLDDVLYQLSLIE